MTLSLNLSTELQSDIEFELEQSRALEAEICERGAPYIFYRDDQHINHLVQGCCNSWECPRCAHIRARREYRRIVNGSEKLGEAGTELYFLTITCKGKEMPLETAEKSYLDWTNKLLSTLRANAKKRGIDWVYVQLTERQERLHPHSHFIATWYPDDGIEVAKGERNPNGRKMTHDAIFSPYWIKANVRVGLGNECDISRIKSPVAVAVYVSKYLFKDTMRTQWPKGWRRIRYSQSFPELPSKTPEVAFPIVRREDWELLADVGGLIYADTKSTVKRAREHWINNVVCASTLKQDISTLNIPDNVIMF